MDGLSALSNACASVTTVAASLQCCLRMLQQACHLAAARRFSQAPQAAADAEQANKAAAEAAMSPLPESDLSDEEPSQTPTAELAGKAPHFTSLML